MIADRPMFYRRNGTPYPPSPDPAIAWAVDFEVSDRHLGKHRSIYGELISTVWLGLDHNLLGSVPLIFESMVFGRGGERTQRRYSTEAQAIAGHAQLRRQTLVPPPLRRFFFDGWD